MMQCSKSLEAGEDIKDNNDKNSKNLPTVSTIYNPKVGYYPQLKVQNITSAKGGTIDGNTKRKTFLEHIKKLSSKLDMKQTKSNLKSQRIKFIYCLIPFFLALLIVSVGIIFFLNPKKHVITRYRIVDGEFQILDTPFEYEMLDKNSPVYGKLASSVINEMDKVYLRSEISEHYIRSELLEVTVDMNIKCLLFFKNNDNVDVGKIGYAFLRSLRLQHGHTLLGNYTINIKSIGFKIRGEEGVWAEWSEWSGCETDKDYVATRTRKCLTRDTLQQTNIDRCLLIPGDKSDLDIMPCRIFKNMHSNSTNTISDDESTEITTSNDALKTIK